MRLYRNFNIQLTSTRRTLLLSDWKEMTVAEAKYRIGKMKEIQEKGCFIDDWLLGVTMDGDNGPLGTDM